MLDPLLREDGLAFRLIASVANFPFLRSIVGPLRPSLLRWAVSAVALFLLQFWPLRIFALIKRWVVSSVLFASFSVTRTWIGVFFGRCLSTILRDLILNNVGEVTPTCFRVRGELYFQTVDFSDGAFGVFLTLRSLAILFG